MIATLAECLGIVSLDRQRGGRRGVGTGGATVTLFGKHSSGWAPERRTRVYNAEYFLQLLLFSAGTFPLSDIQ